jgi:hypothetical protein
MLWIILGFCILQVCLVWLIGDKLRDLDKNCLSANTKDDLSYIISQIRNYGLIDSGQAETINSKIDSLSALLVAQQKLNEVDKGLDKIDAAVKPKPTQKATTKAAPKKTVKGGN